MRLKKTEFQNFTGEPVQSFEHKLGTTAGDVATAILNTSDLKGSDRTVLGANLERELKRFAKLILEQATEEEEEVTSTDS